MPLGLGASDCERLRDGLIAQPVNTASAAAYLLVGAWLVSRSRTRGARRRRFRPLQGSDARHRYMTGSPAGRALPLGAPLRRERLAFGLAVAAAGIGSVDFHGTGSPAARWLHDAGLCAALSFVAVHDLAALGRARTRTVPAAAATAGAGGVLLALVPRVGGALTAGLGALLAGSEAALARGGLRAGWSPRRRTAYRAGLAALTAGAAAWALGRTGGPLCDPDSPLQGHAAWHLLSAAALAAWAMAELEPGPG